MRKPLNVLHDVPLAPHNTLGIAARAAHYLRVEGLAELEAIRAESSLATLPRLVLGGGSNIVLGGDFPGLVLHMAMRGIAVTGETGDAVLVTAAAGENWHGFTRHTLAQGWPGLENLSLIPGSVGAAPIQNIGAYGVELKDRFHSLRLFDWRSGATRTLLRDACQFGYRDSIFKGELAGHAIVLDVTFALPKAWQANLAYAELAAEVRERGWTQPTPGQIAQAVIAIRQRKLPDPAVIGNVGSFFKNPLVSGAQRDALAASFPAMPSYAQGDGSYKLAAGWLIDQCGWKGRSLGQAGVYEKQALVLVNRGGATGAEVMRLAGEIQEDVARRFGVVLEPEPVLV